LKRIKIAIAFGFIAALVAAGASQTQAYPPFLAKARKFGAKDCTFCHVNPEGGEPWNDRGKWLAKEKARRNAEIVDPEWLAEYKPGSPDSSAAPGLSAPATNSVEQEIVNAEKDWMRAVASGDEATLRRLVGDEFAFTSAYSTGEVAGKDDFIKNALTGVKGMDFELHDSRIHVYGDAAVVNTGMKIKYTFNGQDRSGDYLVTDVWVRRDGRWQVVTRHSSLPVRPQPKG
jgi:ketosteroid isomerase-like protein